MAQIVLWLECFLCREHHANVIPHQIALNQAWHPPAVALSRQQGWIGVEILPAVRKGGDGELVPGVLALRASHREGAANHVC